MFNIPGLQHQYPSQYDSTASHFTIRVFLQGVSSKLQLQQRTKLLQLHQGWGIARGITTTVIKQLIAAQFNAAKQLANLFNLPFIPKLALSPTRGYSDPRGVSGRDTGVLSSQGTGPGLCRSRCPHHQPVQCPTAGSCCCCHWQTRRRSSCSCTGALQTQSAVPRKDRVPQSLTTE
jgi:hypothetical protein